MKKKFLILLLIMMLIISLLSVFSEAAQSQYSFIVSMTAKNSRVTAGNEVLITVKLSNLNVGENGISSFTAYLSYDTDVFETLTDSSVDGLNGWVPNYSTGTGKVSLYKRTFLKTDEEIMTIALKTKAGLADGTQGEVKLSTIIVSDGSDEVMSSPVSTSITIGSETAVDPVNPTPTNTVNPIPLNVVPSNITVTPTNTSTQPEPVANTTIIPVNTSALNTTNPTNNNTTNTNVIQNQIRVANESGNDMPYTGTDSNALARIIIGVICISLVIYIKIQRLDKEIK